MLASQSHIKNLRNLQSYKTVLLYVFIHKKQINIPMSPNKENQCNLKKPNEVSEKFGTLNCTLGLKYPEKFPKTCSSMSSVAQAEVRADKARKDGIDDYKIPLQLLMNAFDVFFKEYYGKRASTGDYEKYNLSDSDELTILLTWIIRNILTHSGGCIDIKCKKRYDKILFLAEGVRPIDALPTNLVIDHEFVVNYNSYRSIYECVFKYIRSKTSEEDYSTIRTRSSVTDIKLKECKVSMPLGNGHITFDLEEAYKHGIYISENGVVESPPGTMYCPDSRRIVLPNGQSFPATFKVD